MVLTGPILFSSHASRQSQLLWVQEHNSHSKPRCQCFLSPVSYILSTTPASTMSPQLWKDYIDAPVVAPHSISIYSQCFGPVESLCRHCCLQGKNNSFSEQSWQGHCPVGRNSYLEGIWQAYHVHLEKTTIVTSPLWPETSPARGFWLDLLHQVWITLWSGSQVQSESTGLPRNRLATIAPVNSPCLAA